MLNGEREVVRTSQDRKNQKPMDYPAKRHRRDEFVMFGHKCLYRAIASSKGNPESCCRGREKLGQDRSSSSDLPTPSQL